MMNEYTVRNYLINGGHFGKTNAVKGKQICNYCGITEAELRQAVNSMRVDGFPICSGGTGYYLALNQAELNKTIEQLNNRIAGIQNAIDGLKKITMGVA